MRLGVDQSIETFVIVLHNQSAAIRRFALAGQGASSSRTRRVRDIPADPRHRDHHDHGHRRPHGRLAGRPQAGRPLNTVAPQGATFTFTMTTDYYSLQNSSISA